MFIAQIIKFGQKYFYSTKNIFFDLKIYILLKITYLTNLFVLILKLVIYIFINIFQVKIPPNYHMSQIYVFQNPNVFTIYFLVDLHTCIYIHIFYLKMYYLYKSHLCF